MSNMFKTTKQLNFLIPYGLGWFFVNLLTLNTFPIMHSDEAWLGGLTKTMMTSGSLMTTEPFFDLAPRAPHTLKTFYHLLQMPFISLLGFNLTAVRLLSLVFGLAVLIIVGLWLQSLSDQPLVSLLCLAFITLNSQFIYAAHFARQEMALVFIVILSWHLYTRSEQVSRHTTLFISSLIGLSISLHPNAFIVALMIGAIYIYDWLLKRHPFRLLVLYALPMGILALINVAITLSYTPDFIKRYGAYASTLSVGSAPVSRLVNFMDFYKKLWHGISGTYFLTDLKPLFILFLLALILSIIVRLTGSSSLKGTNSQRLIAMMVGFNLALLIIGRNNPTSIVFLTITMSLYICVTVLALPFKDYQGFLLAIGLVFLLNASYNDYSFAKDHDYEAYTDFLSNALGDDALILGNLSGGFAFEDHAFYDIRNLNYLEEQTIASYIEERQINTLVWYEEYEYIHRNDQWQILYGDDKAYYDDLLTLTQEKGIKIAAYDSPWYGNRIIRYMGDYPWKITVYRIAP